MYPYHCREYYLIQRRNMANDRKQRNKIRIAELDCMRKFTDNAERWVGAHTDNIVGDYIIWKEMEIKLLIKINL